MNNYEYDTKPILILGCGNILFGDDGFGPKVIEYLQNNYKIPDDIEVIDAGTGVREILFDIILSEKKPKKIIIIDAVDYKRQAGEIFELEIEEIPRNKIDDFSMHQLPTSNLLSELQKICKVEVSIIVTQIEYIPEEVKPGISKTLINSIPEVCELILKLSHQDTLINKV